MPRLRDKLCEAATVQRTAMRKALAIRCYSRHEAPLSHARWQAQSSPLPGAIVCARQLSPGAMGRAQQPCPSALAVVQQLSSMCVGMCDAALDAESEMPRLRDNPREAVAVQRTAMREALAIQFYIKREAPLSHVRWQARSSPLPYAMACARQPSPGAMGRAQQPCPSTLAGTQQLSSMHVGMCDAALDTETA
ncbi:hypothetical protein HAX54_000658 [Datura stramonium]|uniref:Uncharacterized protein n=1 Tax=Datura stramonium TaxID=4076 RepID=A0ABS8RSP4_DATST|nr:hypothetical protein [Datura stramonium]